MWSTVTPQMVASKAGRAKGTGAEIAGRVGVGAGTQEASSSSLSAVGIDVL